MADILAPNSDGTRLWYIGLDRYANYAETLPDMPTDEELEAYAREREARPGAERMILEAVERQRLSLEARRADAHLRSL